MKKVRFGITGSGYMGRTHGEAIQHLGETAELVAVWGGTRAAGLAGRLRVANAPTLEALMQREDIDAIVITTPHHLHAREAIMALESGKHVLVEKPMATTVED
ncbi:MAG: Gfo/Idh/MocA family oxidoreductase, partial [Opitutaceae bacterium]